MKSGKVPYTIYYSPLTIHKPFRAFTLVEVLIVVAILGILAAVILPEYRNYTQKARESAAKESLQMLRTAIERYALQHNGIPPGYPNDIPTAPHSLIFVWHMRNNYLNEIPKNPFNSLQTVKVLQNNESFPESPSGDTGWIYKAATKTIRLNSAGTDSQGMEYYTY
jgi:prepilin-type N-terminal cleavage/methylation domain-containing protein